MTIHQLHNRDWGYETNCFVCAPDNRAGLRIPFFHDDTSDMVFADLALGEAYSSAPTILHGGVLLALLDEAQAWACIAVGGRFALTTRTTSEFSSVLMVDTPYRVEARLNHATERKITTDGRIVDSDGAVHVTSTSEFAVLSEAMLERTVGLEATEGVQEHLR